MVLQPKVTHSEGESNPTSIGTEKEQLNLDTFDGKVFVEWDPEAAVTPLAQLPFFIEYLKLGRRFEPLVDDCPLEYTSNNAPEKIDVLGVLFL